MEGQERLELSTPCLRGRCSNQLSYWPASELTFEASFCRKRQSFVSSLFLLSKNETALKLGFIFWQGRKNLTE